MSAVIHFATTATATACGASTDYATWTDEPEGVAGCGECLAAAAAPTGCPGGCGDAVSCFCYGVGYVAGKDKAHLEVRTILERNHAGDCGCEPCITRRTVRAEAVFQAAKWAATMVFHQHGYATADERLAAGVDVGSLTADCVHASGGDVGKAAGLAVTAAFRMLENLAAQRAGTSDPLGLDPTDRLRSWRGRYDGAE